MMHQPNKDRTTTPPTGKKEIDFTTSKRLIDFGIIVTENNLRIHVFLSEHGEIISTNTLSPIDKLKVIVLFFEDVFNNIKRLGDFVDYGICTFPVSFSKHNINDVWQFNGTEDNFKNRLLMLRKEYYDIMLAYVNENY